MYNRNSNDRCTSYIPDNIVFSIPVGPQVHTGSSILTGDTPPKNNLGKNGDIYIMAIY